MRQAASAFGVRYADERGRRERLSVLKWKKEDEEREESMFWFAAYTLV